jgi:L-threonylcarbamoyladenylate synthase
MIAERDVDRALQELNAGRPIVLPTDTVYGLAALPQNPAAVEAVFAAKGKPLPVLGASVEDLEDIVQLDEDALVLAHAFWPGPLTLVVPRAVDLPWRLGSEPSAMIAVRIPRCDIALRVLERSGPLAVTSANRSGHSPATTVAEARAALGGEVNVYLDGGPRAGVASTVVTLSLGPRVLRRGAITESDITHALEKRLRE